MNFGDAFNIIKKDKTIGMRLIEWESDIVVRVQFPNRLSYMTQPYLYQSTGYNLENVPFIPSMGDLFREDWKVI